MKKNSEGEERKVKYCSIGFRLAALICICTLFFVTGCGAGSNQSGITESAAAQNDRGETDTGSDADITTEPPASPESDSGTAADGVHAIPDTDSATVAAEQEGGLVTDAETLQAVIDIAEQSADQTVLEYADFTTEEFLAEVAAVYQIAHDNGYVYGDSQTTPPCEDGIISCDRLIARALWNLGMTDQPEKGMNVGKEVAYLTTHGFELVTDQSQLKPGDIVMQDNGVSGIPNWRWHTFVLVSYDPETTMCEKYDCGHFTPEGKDRISSEQPFVCPLADYGIQRRFVCGFHLKQKPAE